MNFRAITLSAVLSFFIAVTVSQSAFAAKAKAKKGKGNACGAQTKLTAYSGGKCKNDPQGGGSSSSGGCGNPRHHTLKYGSGEATRDINTQWVMAAIPQKGGPPGLKLKGCFKIDQFPGVVFKACDHYGKGSNGMNKIDISMDCENMKGGDALPGLKFPRCGEVQTTPCNGGNEGDIPTSKKRKMVEISLPHDYMDVMDLLNGY